MHVRFERSDAALEAAGDAASSLVSHLTVGPFDWIQVTYGELRVAAIAYGHDGGDVIARQDEGGGWVLVPHYCYATHLIRLATSEADRVHFFSDFVVY